MPPALPRRRSRPATAAVVVGVHALALLALLRLGTWGERGPPRREQPPLVLRWLRDVPPTTPATPAAQPQPAAPLSAQFKRQALPTPPPQTAPQAITLPAPDDPRPSPAPAPAAAAPPAATGAAPPLNLALPRGASATWSPRPSPMDDLRANTPRATVESRLAAAMAATAAGSKSCRTTTATRRTSATAAATSASTSTSRVRRS